MRVTIIPEDKWIRRDNKEVHLREWNFNDSNIHAIQWYDTEGEIEYKENPPRTEAITDISILEPYMNALDSYLNEIQEIQLELQKSDEEILENILNL